MRKVLYQSPDGMAGNLSLLHSNGFEFETECGLRAGRDIGLVRKSCCGDYPSRKPYNENVFDCCSGSVQLFC